MGKRHKHQNREFQLKPLAQAVTLACASLAANSAYADACTAVGTTIIAASTSDSCILGNDAGVDTGVTVNNGVLLGTSGSTTGVRVTAGFAAGAITNNGTILGSSSSTGYGIFLAPGSSLSGGISNNGTIRGKATSSTTAFGFGIFASSATINGGITNNTGGLIEGSGWGTASTNGGVGIGLKNSSVTGGIDNTGTIRGMSTSSSTGTWAGFGIQAISSSSITGGITNNTGGLIEGIGYEAGYGIYLDNSTVDNITNDGRIHGSSTTGSSGSYGIYLLNGASNSGSIINNASGQITGSGNAGSSGFGIALSASSISGNISNAGTIKGIDLSSGSAFGISLNSSSSIGGGISNSGTIQGTASSSGSAFGIQLRNSSSISGGITNNGGTIQGIGSGSGGGQGIVLKFTSSISGGIINSGTIKGSASLSSSGYGIQLRNSSTITGGVNNSGIIQGIAGTRNGTGIRLNGVGSSISGGIVNSGTIKGTAGNSNGMGINVRFGASITGDINNSGTIQGSAVTSGAAGIWLNNNSSITGKIINSGTIKATAAAFATGIAVTSSSISGGITNNAGGLITGSLNGISIVSPTAPVSIINDGTISGGTAAINVSNGTLNLSGTGTTGAITGNIANSNLNIVNTFISGGNISNFLNVTVTDGGTFNLGHNITATTLIVGGGTSGILDVATTTVTDTGAFNMAAGSTFKTTINGAANDQSGKIVVSGAATVPTTAKIDINTGAVSLVAGTTYTIISDGAGGGGIAVPATITDNNAGFDFTGSLLGGSLVLTVIVTPTLVPAGTTGLSANASAIQTAVNTFIAADPALAAAFGGLVTSSQINAALESLTPDMSGAAQNATFGAHSFSIDTIVKRLLSLRTAGGGMMTGLAAGDAYTQGEVGTWIQGFGSTIDQDNRQGISGFDADTIGAAFGADTLLTKNLRVGAAFSYGSTDVDTKGSANTTDIDSYQGALYASYESGEYYIDGIASYALNDYDGSRNVVVGAVNRIAASDYDADQFGIKGTVGRIYKYRNMDVSPYVSLNYVRLDTDGYTETGAGAANLIVGEEETDVLQSTVGISISKEMETRTGMRFIPEAHIAWLHEYLDEQQTNTSNFTSGGGSFTTNGFDPANDSINAGVSVAVYQTESLDIRAAYDFEGKSDYDSHSGQLTLRYTFY